jgi:hypothetical protein
MKKTCENCPKISICKEACQDINSLLELLPKYLPERPLSDFKKASSSDDEEDEERLTIDDIIKIDPGRMFDDVEDTNIDWTQTMPQPRSADLDGAENKILKEAIQWAIPRGNLKLRRRFNAFLECSKIVDIAETANTTKQNIQKQFQSIIRRAHQIIKRNSKKLDYDPSPLQFKIKVRQL